MVSRQQAIRPTEEDVLWISARTLSFSNMPRHVKTQDAPVEDPVGTFAGKGKNASFAAKAGAGLAASAMLLSVPGSVGLAMGAAAIGLARHRKGSGGDIDAESGEKENPLPPETK